MSRQSSISWLATSVNSRRRWCLLVARAHHLGWGVMTTPALLERLIEPLISSRLW